MFKGSFHFFSFGMAFGMLLFDCFLFVFLIYYLEAVLPIDDSPRQNLFFIFKVSFLYIIIKYVKF